MSWRQGGHSTRRRPPRRNQGRLLFWLTCALVVLNVAVVCYHGDPRALFGKKAAGRQKQAERTARSLGAGRAAHALGRVGAWLLPSAHAAVGPEAPAAAFAPAPAGAGLASAPAFVGPPLPLNPLAELRTPGLVQRIERVQLGHGRSAAHALQAIGVHPEDVRGIVHQLGQRIELTRMRPTDALKVRFDGTGRLVSVELTRGPLEQIVVRRQAGSFVAERQRIPVDTVVQEVTGEIVSSLWDALVQSGEDPRLAQQLVDIFSYEVDFYSEVRTGDVFRLLVEKRYAHGQFLGYGDMLAAELVCGKDTHRAFLHRRDGVAEYFDENGGAMRKQLLRMPLQYGAVTSRFAKRRRHPILGYTRAHNGTDYGVPIGTPCWSVGDGKVIRAGWHGGYGRLVEVAHANGWVSQYAHLSHINVRVGQKVRQKQVVGLVGMTGLATGPHLHYGLKHKGAFVNSLAQHFERARALTGEPLAAFRQDVVRYMGELDKLQVAHDPRLAPANAAEKG